jgi:hypothetical protein
VRTKQITRYIQRATCRSGTSLCFGTSVMANVRRLMSIFRTVLTEEKRNGTEV